MKLFDVYPLFDVNIVKGKGCRVWDEKGQEYLDVYGGHAVISIGHSHPHYIQKVAEQLEQIGFYSNSVINKLQQQLAERLGKISGYDDYQLFLINSGAEANENALKLASFTNGRTRVLSAQKAFDKILRLAQKGSEFAIRSEREDSHWMRPARSRALVRAGKAPRALSRGFWPLEGETVRTPNSEHGPQRGPRRQRRDAARRNRGRERAGSEK